MKENVLPNTKEDVYYFTETFPMAQRGHDGSRVCYQVNKRLLPVKGIYFTFIAGIGALIPFLPVYMKQLGLTSTETGILIGTVPFIAFFVQPAFGAVADRTRRPKIVLICCFICSGIFFGLLLVTPRKTGAENCIEKSILVQCEEDGARFWDSECVFRNKSSVVIMFEQFLKETNRDGCSLVCGGSLTNIVNFNKSLFDNNRPIVKLNSNVSYGANLESYLNGSEYLMEYLDVRDHCQIFDHVDANMSDLHIWNQICESQNNANKICNLQCTTGEHSICLSQNVDSNKTFWVISVMYLLANIFHAPITSLVDAIAYNILAEKRKLWGRQRLWGTIGFAVFAMTSTIVMDVVEQAHGSVDYSVSFYVFIGLCILSSLIVLFLDITESIKCRKILKNITALFRFPDVVGFLLVVTCLGTLHFAYFGFLFWFLEDLGSNQIILGLCLVINSISEVAMLFVSGKVINLIGHVPCLYIALLAYAVRYLCYSFLTNAWFVLPIELLHGVSFGLMYAAATAYASIIAPKGLSATVQGLMAGLYFGFGRGISGIVTGKLFDQSSGLGERWSFRFYSFFSLFVLFLYAATNTILAHRKRKLKSRNEADTKNESDDNNIQVEPFLDMKV